MKQVNWKQKVFVQGVMVAEIDRTNTIGEYRSYNLITPLLERVRVVIEFVEPGVWVKKYSR